MLPIKVPETAVEIDAQGCVRKRPSAVETEAKVLLKHH